LFVFPNDRLARLNLHYDLEFVEFANFDRPPMFAVDAKEFRRNNIVIDGSLCS
jgi:hypothetical protein